MLALDVNQWVPFVGRVEDIKDPLHLGRVKIRVINHDENTITTEDLNWATPIQPTTSAATQQVGSSPTWLLVGSLVVGFFLDGVARTIPLIMGTLATIPGNDVQNHDVSALARGTNTVTASTEGPEPASSFNAQYGFNKTITTTSGHIVELDDTPGHERVNVRHKSGSYVEINNVGQVVIKSVDNLFTIVSGDQTNYTKGNSNTNVKGALTIGVEGDANISAKGDINVTGSKTVNITGKRVNIN